MNLAIADAHDAVAASSSKPLGRVLFVIDLDPSQKFGSLEEQMVILGRRFREQGSLFLPVFNWPTRPDEPTPLERQGLAIECLDMDRFHWRSLSRLLELASRHQIDIVHWNFAPPLSNSYMWWLSILRPRVKHYLTDHNSRILPLTGAPGGIKKPCKRLLLRRYARVVCISKFVEDCLRRQEIWSNLVCCLHFVNPDRFQPDPEVRARLRAQHQADDRFVLLTVGQLIKEKGMDVLIRALKLLPARVTLWIIGSGAEERSLRDLVRQLELEDRVLFHGMQRNVEAFMQAADCFVCPSRWEEAAGLVNLEAQAAGLPVIASRVGGIPEYVLEGQTSMLFPVDDHAGLADCVLRLLGDPGLTLNLGQAARALVLERFSPQARVADYLDLYRN